MQLPADPTALLSSTCHICSRACGPASRAADLPSSVPFGSQKTLLNRRIEELQLSSNQLRSVENHNWMTPDILPCASMGTDQ
jgi:hypothetical protein